MTLFEYLAIAFSLVLSFSAMRLVGGLPHAVRPGARDWIHLAFVVALLFNVTSAFWVYWSMRTVEWDYSRFLLALVNPGIIYFMSCTIMPENPETVASWRAHFDTVRRRYYFGLGCWALSISAGSSVLLGVPLWHPIRFGHVIALCAAVLGYSSADRRVHAGIAIFSLASVVVLVFSVFAAPGPLTSAP